jgi:hypothetical protein
LGLVLFAKPPPVDVSAHLDGSTTAFWLALAGLVAFFALRPEIWRRIWFRRVDPRAAGLLRIVFGTAILWTFLDLLRVSEIVFTDEGLYLTDMARQKFGGRLRNVYDPEYGFESSFAILDALWSKFSILHLRSDPSFVYTLYAVMLTANVLMILGVFTRVATVITWVLVNSFYNYSPIFLAGGDTALRAIFFLALFLRWGEAYSLDSLRRRRKAILAGGSGIPALRSIPAWPLVLMMIQLSIIYVSTGFLKSGGTWRDGTALYYALNLDHFYRVPMQEVTTFMHWTGFSRLATWIVHLWQRLFWLALVGVALRGFEADKAAGTWPVTSRSRRWLSYASLGVVWSAAIYLAGLVGFYWPQRVGMGTDHDGARVTMMALGFAVPLVVVLGYRTLRRYPGPRDVVIHGFLGKRVFLTLGLIFHGLIDIWLNVGTFVQVMITPYVAWLGAKEIDGFWRVMLWKPAEMGEHGRPVRPALLHRDPEAKGWRRRLGTIGLPLVVIARAGQRFTDGLRHRLPPTPYRVAVPEDTKTLRRAALLRLWDLGERWSFERDDSLAPGTVRVQLGGHDLSEDDVARALLRTIPGLWWLRPLGWLQPARALARRIVELPRPVIPAAEPVPIEPSGKRWGNAA